MQFSCVCLDVEFVINSALADDGTSFASKHVETIVFVHDPPHNIKVLSSPSKLRNLTLKFCF